MENNGMSWMDLASIAGLVVIILGAVIGAPLWITDKNSKMKGELYSAMSKNKDECTATKERVSVLEERAKSTDEKVEKVTGDVRDVKETLTQMQQENQKNHIDLLTAINKR